MQTQTSSLLDVAPTAQSDTSAWPRFSEVKEPRMICLHCGNAAGSKAFQSYLDGHPEIYMVPAYPLTYLYPHWFQWQDELGDDRSWATLIEKFCLQHASVINSERIPGHNGMRTLGSSQDEGVAIDETLFRNYLSHLLDGEPVASRTFTLAVHYAYAFCRGEDLSQKKVLLYHIHVPVFVRDYLYPDFPEMLTIGLVRDQRSNIKGRYVHSAVNVENIRLNKTDAIVYRRRTYYQISRLLYEGSEVVKDIPTERVRVICAEDLVHRREKVLQAVADYIGITFHPTLRDSTFGGLAYWGDPIYNMKPMNTFNPRMASEEWKATLAPMDWFVLEGLFHNYSRAYGYPDYKYTEDSALNRALLLGAIMLPSKVERQEALNYLNPLYFAKFIAVALDEASGRTEIKDYSFNAHYRHRWTSNDLNLWKPRWYMRFLLNTRRRAEKAKIPGLATVVRSVGQVVYVGANIGRYTHAVVSHYYWIYRRIRLCFEAYGRMVTRSDTISQTLPLDAASTRRGATP